MTKTVAAKNVRKSKPSGNNTSSWRLLRAICLPLLYLSRICLPRPRRWISGPAFCPPDCRICIGLCTHCMSLLASLLWPELPQLFHALHDVLRQNLLESLKLLLSLHLPPSPNPKVSFPDPKLHGYLPISSPIFTSPISANATIQPCISKSLAVFHFLSIHFKEVEPQIEYCKLYKTWIRFSKSFKIGSQPARCSKLTTGDSKWLWTLKLHHTAVSIFKIESWTTFTWKVMHRCVIVALRSCANCPFRTSSSRSYRSTRNVWTFMTYIHTVIRTHSCHRVGLGQMLACLSETHQFKGVSSGLFYDIWIYLHTNIFTKALRQVVDRVDQITK